MKRLAISGALLSSLFLFTSCNSEPQYSLSKVQKEVGSTVEPLQDKEKKQLKGILKVLFPQNWEIIEIFKITNSEKPFLSKYLVKIYSPYEHIIWNKFIWLTKDGEILIPKAYQVNSQAVSLIVPKNEKEYPLENLRWILDIERITLEGNIPTKLTAGKKVVHLIWNPYCKKCFDQWKELLNKAKTLKVSIELIPYHNVYYPMDNLYMLIFLLWKAQNEGLLSVLNTYYNQSKSFEDFLTKLKKDTFTNLNKVPKETFNSIGFSLKQIARTLQGAKIYAVPTTVLVKRMSPTVGLAEGYVLVNQIVLQEPKNAY